MAPSKPSPPKYPRATLRKILIGHARKKIGKQVETLVYLDYIVFMNSWVHHTTVIYAMLICVQVDGERRAKGEGVGRDEDRGARY
jgi:hypothetical protein